MQYICTCIHIHDYINFNHKKAWSNKIPLTNFYDELQKLIIRFIIVE